MPRLHEEFQRFNVFRRPEWRFERVLKMCDRYPSPGRSTSRDDAFVKTARNFVLRWRARDEEERMELWEETPGLFYAYQIYERAEEHPEPSLFLQARLLARQDHQEIAECLSTMPDTVEWYEKLFFNVTDRLDNRDWVTKHVLLPAILRQHGVSPVLDNDSDDDSDENDDIDLPFTSKPVAKPFLDASLKLFAYFGGKHLVDVMITGFQSGKPLNSQEDMAGWFDSHWKMAIRRRSHQASLNFEINKFNVMELFAIHTRLMEIEKSEESQDQQRSTVERHVKALIDEIPWAVGDDGRKMLEGSKLGLIDEGAAELRDGELLQIASGANITLDMPTELPPPRRSKTALQTVLKGGALDEIKPPEET